MEVTDGFQGLDLIDRVHEKLQTEVYNIEQKMVTKTITKKKKCKKAKWLSEEALQRAQKRRELKSKGERGRYIQLNAEFQRTASRDMKAFLSEQCKEIEEKKRMEKTRDFFKKIGDRIFHVRMNTIKG